LCGSGLSGAASAARFDQRRHGGAVTAQRLQRARFVGLHEAGISFNIGA
jgi:hypothetical protein